MKNVKRILALVSATVMTATALSSCSLNFGKDEGPVTIEKKQTEKIERLPGIAVWGGSMSYGAYGEGKSITRTIENHMMDDECYIPIANMAVPQETTCTIMARAGAVDLLVKEFIIPEGIEQVEVKIYAADGSTVAPLRYGTRWDGGMTNVTIAGVEGALSIDENTMNFENPVYYFIRNSEGESVHVEEGEKVISDSMTEYTDYIPVICMGDHGGWTSFEQLIEQQQAIIDTSSNSDKFLIVGLFSVPLTEEQLQSVEDDDEAKEELIRKNNEEFDKAMEKKWGDHYVNARESLCSNVALEKLQNADVSVSIQDKIDMSKGVVPNALKHDANTLNNYGYDIVGDAVYQKLVALGYLYN